MRYQRIEPGSRFDRVPRTQCRSAG